MARRNGMGPNEEGPKTGRGLGNCQTNTIPTDQSVSTKKTCRRLFRKLRKNRPNNSNS